MAPTPVLPPQARPRSPLVLIPFTWSIGLLLLLALVPPLYAVDSGQEVHRIQQAYFAGDASLLKIGVAAGVIRIEGTDSQNVEAELVLTCSRSNLEKCTNRAQRLQIVPRMSRGVLRLRLKRTPRGLLQGIESELRIKAPRGMNVEIDLKGGDVFVQGMESNLEIDSAGSRIDVVYRQDLVGPVDVKVGVGKATLWLREGKVEGSGFPRGIEWTGTGEAVIEIDVGGGEVTVRLE